MVVEVVVPPTTQNNNDEARMLARMLRLGESEHRVWRPEELGEVLAHQLAAPVVVDLESLDPGLGARLRDLCSSRSLVLNSFADLFFHPQPPLELLELTRQFARACRSHPDAMLPHEIATLLYVMSIVVAMLRCGARITTLDDGALRSAIVWLIEQPWVEPRLVGLLNEGLRHLAARPESSA
jgi:hypothetical protein